MTFIGILVLLIYVIVFIVCIVSIRRMKKEMYKEVKANVTLIGEDINKFEEIREQLKEIARNEEDCTDEMVINRLVYYALRHYEVIKL